MRRLLKVEPSGRSSVDEVRFDLAYYRRMSSAQRFRLLIERSILLLKTAGLNATDRKAPAIIKRR